MIRRLAWCIAAAAFAVSGCGGTGDSPLPVSPTAPVTTTTTSTPNPYRWSITGQVVDTGSRQPIAGATVAPSWQVSPVTTDAQGTYLLGDHTNPPSSPYRVDVSADGFITHAMWIPFRAGTTTGVGLDAIADRAPFSLDFYRQLVRGTYDDPGAPWPIQRWTSAPSFYVKTTDESGRPIEPEVVSTTLDAIRRAVPAWTGGRFGSPVIETGTAARLHRSGWILVDIRRRPEAGVCGLADIGANPGHITLNDDVCSCGSTKIPGAVTMHEVGHALGFFHVSDRRSIMYPFVAGDCPGGELSAAEAFHAAIAYSRPRGNTEPDQDPAPASNTILSPLGRVR
jgi:hypothetical protein